MIITKENIFEEIEKMNYLEVLKSDLVDKHKNHNGITPLHSLALMEFKEVLNHPSVDKVKDAYGGWTPLQILTHWEHISIEDLRIKYPWYKKEITNIEEVIREILNTPTSVKFILEDS